MRKKQYFCIVFFMVLDLRLMEIGLSRDNPSFFLADCPRLTEERPRY